MRWTASSLRHDCAYPNVLSKLVPRSTSNKRACDKGTMFHEAVATWACQELPKPPRTLDSEVNGWLSALAANWSPSLGNGEYYEIPMGLSVVGRFVNVEEVSPHVYVAVKPDCMPLLTAGRADVVSYADGVAIVRDWKTGRHAEMDVRESLQLTALAFAAADMLNADAFVRELYWTRDGRTYADAEPIRLDSDAAAEAWSMLEKAARLDETPRPGVHCEKCWEKKLKRCTFAADRHGVR